MSIKQEVYELLQKAAPEGVTVRQSSQGVAAVLPAITFTAINTTNHRDLSGEIYSREASVQIDAWSDNSPETSELEDIVEEAMREAGWGMSGSQDVADSDPKIYHKMLTFDTIKT